MFIIFHLSTAFEKGFRFCRNISADQNNVDYSNRSERNIISPRTVQDNKLHSTQNICQMHPFTVISIFPS